MASEAVELAGGPASRGAPPTALAPDRPGAPDRYRPPRLGLRGQPFFEDKNRAFWLLQSAGWTGYFVLRSVGNIANQVSAVFVIHTALLTAAGYSLTLLMAAVYRKLLRLRPLVTWSATAAVVLVAAALYSAIETWSWATFLRPGAQPDSAEYLGAILLGFILLTAWTGLYYGVNYYLLLEEQVDQMVRLESQASAAQLAMLRYQLNPHFLFNTLNSISTLVLLKQTDRANAMLSRLSSFLRYTLVNEPTAQVTLAQEMETLKLYLEIEKMRFEARLRPHFFLDPAAAKARLPSLLLQPLVENAIKYAVTPQEEGADIRIDARRDGSRVEISVADTGPGPTADVGRRAVTSTGVGLQNIRDRLTQAFGPDARFDVGSNADGGFTVTIAIPFQASEAKG
ncbi:MAG: Autolysin sensor kinase [uncultured Sphingomonadaceae bacterium]|uniref:Autolysin sensor kinase n=1 Tax=uncultured Sphingomonadaceae bacterium TaxID=169976 RepID=A0A6J4RRE4_9SPHN|nr:MAG: Autolysin sensor kinase [uncultured Sphingomonadaceae bacterium]